MKKHLYIFLFILIVLLFCVYKFFFEFYIIAKFQELRPHLKNMPVYYKGIVVGRAGEKVHSKDYQHTLMKIILYKNNMLLPDNTTILLKKEKRNNKERDFLEIVYPKEPTKIMISKGSEIKGIATVDIDTFMSNHHPDELEEIKENLLNASQNLEIALGSLGDLFVSIDDMVNENRKNIKFATRNFANTTRNLSNTTLKFDNSIKQNALNETIQNVDKSIENLGGVTNNTNEITKQAQDLMCNLNTISCGVRRALSKPFGFFRLFFGKVIN